MTALPLTSLFALLANVVEIRCDGWKLLNVHQRPFPRGGEDIGNWQTVFLIVSVASVVTNAGLIVFCMDALPTEYSVAVRYWIFILFQWVLFSFQVILNVLY